MTYICRAIKDKAMQSLTIKIRIRKLEKQFIRDRWGNLTPCFWNEMLKQDILNLEAQLNQEGVK